ncbi:hypothetical protein ACQ4PT_006768 [Festuca glaucescens]
MASSNPPWSEIPQDVLDLVIDRLVSTTGRSLSSRAWSRLPRRLRFSTALSRPLQLLRSSAAFKAMRRAWRSASGSNSFKAVRRARHLVAADRARFRGVCRSWHLAMREHVPAARQLPWIVMSDGSFLTPLDTDCTSPPRILSLPSNARCIGSTNSWLLLDRAGDNAANMHSYFLHNPFSDTTVPLPELDSVIGNVSKLFKVLKVLMRSTPHDIIALMTNT